MSEHAQTAQLLCVDRVWTMCALSPVLLACVGRLRVVCKHWGHGNPEKRLPGGEEELLIRLMTACVPRTGNSSFLLGACAMLSHSVVSNCV